MTPLSTEAQGKRDRLLDEGVTTFLTQGYHGTGIKDILDRVGVPRGSFYYYFESKEEFAGAAIARYAECFANKLDEALAGAADPLAGLRAFFETLMGEFEAAGYGGGCLIANLGGELEKSEICRDALAEGWAAWRDRVAHALERAQTLGTVRTDIGARDLADLLTDAWEGAVIRMKIEGSVAPLRRVVDRLLGEYLRAGSA